MGRLTHVDRDPGRDLVHKPPMILMSVGDEDAERRMAGLRGSDGGMRHHGGIFAVQWHP